MDTALFIIAALAASAPIAAAVLVSIGSRLEDRDWTLGEPEVGPVRTIARRILAFHTDGLRWSRSRSRSKASAPSGAGAASRWSAREPEGGDEPAEAEPPRLLLASR